MVQCKRYARAALLAIAVALTLPWDGAGAVNIMPTDTQDKLNILHGLTRVKWQADYDTLRMDPQYNFVDWSQDNCSSPWYVPGIYDGVFEYGCLRHDMMWRTLPVTDAGTGKVWNERNRLAADRKFRSDNYDACNTRYPIDFYPYTWSDCYIAGGGYYEAVRRHKYDHSHNTAESSSVNRFPWFVVYPPGTTTVTCHPSPASGRCLPVHYIAVSDRPFSPQNLPYIETGKVVEAQVLRAHLQYNSTL